MELNAANETIIASAYAALAEGDLDAFCALLDPAARLYHADSLPFGGLYAGVEQIRLGIEWQLDGWKDRRVRVEQLTSWHDRVIAYLSVCGRRTATGASEAGPAAEAWRLAHGRIVEWRVFHWDTHRLLHCYGQ
jgi:ketosteroid isomerase-like protein